MDLQERIARLPVEKRALFEQRLLKDRGAPPSNIPQRGRMEDCPLSFAQQRLWFLDQLQPGCPAYHMRSSMRLRGLLHVGALERSLNEIIRRHEALRTTFPTIEEHPVQCIAPA